jgi:hypothetical protein
MCPGMCPGTEVVGVEFLNTKTGHHGAHSPLLLLPSHTREKKKEREGERRERIKVINKCAPKG